MGIRILRERFFLAIGDDLAIHEKTDATPDPERTVFVLVPPPPRLTTRLLAGETTEERRDASLQLLEECLVEVVGLCDADGNETEFDRAMIRDGRLPAMISDALIGFLIERLFPGGLALGKLLRSSQSVRSHSGTPTRVQRPAKSAKTSGRKRG